MRAQAVVIVGPVIGEVTDTTARILLEVSAPGPLTVVLSPAGTGAGPSAALEFVGHFIADVPSVVFCKGLAPGTRWVVHMDLAAMGDDYRRWCGPLSPPPCATVAPTPASCWTVDLWVSCPLDVRISM